MANLERPSVPSPVGRPAPLMAALLFVVIPSACSVPDGNDPPEGAPASAWTGEDVVRPAAGSWSGDLPCADCGGIRTVLELRPDGLFRMQEGYLGRGPEGDTLFASYGRWEREPEGGRITLVTSSGVDARYLRTTARGGLRVLDLQGEEIHSDLPLELDPLQAPPSLEGLARILGAFTYLADAAQVVECRSGVPLPVTMEGGYLELERAYMASGVEPGSPLRVRMTGRVVERPAMDGPGSEEVFLVERFEGSEPDAPCPALSVRDRLAGATWELRELDGAILPADEPTPFAVPNLAWDPAESRVAGGAGCNNYTGPGFLRGTLLVTRELITTRRFCEGRMAIEDRFLEVIGAGGILRLDGDTLVLRHGPDRVGAFVPLESAPSGS